MTLSIMLIEEKTYKDKIAKTLFETIRTAPKAKDYVNLLKSKKKADLKGLIPAMADVLLISTDRSAHKEILFHAVMGTAMENFGLLSQITGYGTWHPRSQVGSVFLKKNKKKVEVTELIKLLYVSRMAPACQTTLVANNEPQISNSMVFSGKRKRAFSNELMKHFADSTGGIAYGFNVHSLTSALIQEKGKMLRGDEYASAGTGAWVKMENVKFDAVSKTYTFGLIPKEPVVFAETAGAYFFKPSE